MMNKLTIKLAARQAQGIGIFPSFHGSSKEKNQTKEFLLKLSREAFTAPVGFQVRNGWKKKCHAFIRMCAMT